MIPSRGWPPAILMMTNGFKCWPRGKFFFACWTTPYRTKTYLLNIQSFVSSYSYSLQIPVFCKTREQFPLLNRKAVYWADVLWMGQSQGWLKLVQWPWACHFQRAYGWIASFSLCYLNCYFHLLILFPNYANASWHEVWDRLQTPTQNHSKIMMQELNFWMVSHSLLAWMLILLLNLLHHKISRYPFIMFTYSDQLNMPDMKHANSAKYPLRSLNKIMRIALFLTF